MTTLVDAVSQVGLHVIIYGERGVGKTSIANVIGPLLRVFDNPEEDDQAGASDRIVVKVNANSEDSFASLWARAFDEIVSTSAGPKFGFTQEYEAESRTLLEEMGGEKQISIDRVRRMLTTLPGSVFVFDEFDRLTREHSRPFTDLIKVLSDQAVDSTVVIVGVSETVSDLIADHASISRALVQIPMPRMKPDELAEILKKAEAAISVRFDAAASSRIIRMSQGLPHYTHLVGLHAVRCACERRQRRVEVAHVSDGFDRAVKQALESIQSSYANATHSAQPDALYSHVLLACAIAAYRPDVEHGLFQAAHVVEPLGTVLEREVQISKFNKHLNEFCEDAKRGRVLERRGQLRSYRYRFRDPLMPPYVLMRSMVTGLLQETTLTKLLDFNVSD